MILKSLMVGGFKNVKSTKLNFTSKTLAIVSPNNYGKSNLLEALDFATDFISAGAKQRPMGFPSPEIWIALHSNLI